MKILIVDDHAMIRSGLKDLLEQIPGAILLEADSGQKALAVQQAERPRMIVQDLNLPGISGLELLRQLLALIARRRCCRQLLGDIGLDITHALADTGDGSA